MGLNGDSDLMSLSPSGPPARPDICSVGVGGRGVGIRLAAKVCDEVGEGEGEDAGGNGVGEGGGGGAGGEVTIGVIVGGAAMIVVAGGGMRGVGTVGGAGTVTAATSSPSSFFISFPSFFTCTCGTTTKPAPGSKLTSQAEIMIV